MKRHSVFITRATPEEATALLASEGFIVHQNSLPRGLSREEMLKEVARHDAVICQAPDRIDADVLAAAAPRCRIFANCAVGYDNIDIAAASRLGIVISNTPGVLTEATADLTWALMLAAARRVCEGDRVVRAGQWRGWGMLDYLGADVFGKTLGIIGGGRIAAAVARRAAGFNMRVIYTSRSEKAAMNEAGGRRMPCDDVLREADVVSIHVALTDETHKLFDERAFAKLKREAILINTARGAIVDEQALIAALFSGRLAAAGLDVYTDEPDVPPELAGLKNVVLLPHIGSATVTTRVKMACLAADNVIAVLGGRPPLTPVVKT